MKKLNLGEAVAIVANIGVIAGIVFLAIELRQNTEAQHAQTQFDQNERRTEVIEEFFRNPPLTSAYMKLVNQEPITREEDFMLSAYALRVFMSMEWIHETELRNGAERDPTYQRRLFYNAGIGGYDFPFLATYWDKNKTGLEPGFRRWIEENVIDQGPLN